MSPDNPNPKEASTSKYATLHERGVILEDEQIDLITSFIEAGAEDAKIHLGQDRDLWCNFISSETGRYPGYVPDEREAINLPINWLNQLANTDLLNDQVVVWSIPEVELENIMSWSRWLRVMGREETIHHYQHTKLPGLIHEFSTTASPEKTSTQAQTRWQPYEIEARKLVDEISVAKGEPPVWRLFDANHNLVENRDW